MKQEELPADKGQKNLSVGRGKEWFSR